MMSILFSDAGAIKTMARVSCERDRRKTCGLRGNRRLSFVAPDDPFAALHTVHPELAASRARVELALFCHVSPPSSSRSIDGALRSGLAPLLRVTRSTMSRIDLLVEGCVGVRHRQPPLRVKMPIQNTPKKTPSNMMTRQKE